MKILVIGSGGREHTLVWKLKQSKKVEKIFCAPGNGGISLQAKCINIKAENIKALADFASRNKINLTVVGPEQPLAMGIVDEFQKRKLKIFGPEKKAAQLESSKVFAKQFMKKNHIPTAPFKVFNSHAEAIGFCKSVEFPIVIKADGLAAGKGVVIVKSYEEACSVIESIMIKNAFGKAGEQIVIESFLRGQEISIMAVTDGKTIIPMLSSQDHKQAYDGDKGPNTGGMGAYCPTNFVNAEVMEHIEDFILKPTITGLRMLKSDLVDIMTAVTDKKLGGLPKLDWRRGYSACVVMTSRGYPGKYNTGHQITGLKKSWSNGNFVFHAGTRKDNNNWFTTGGRVLGVTGLNNNLRDALNSAYSLVKKIKYEGATYRRDIGFRAFQPSESTSVINNG